MKPAILFLTFPVFTDLYLRSGLCLCHLAIGR